MHADAGFGTSVDALHLLDAAPDAMLVTQRDGAILLVNLQAEKLFGYSREEMLGHPLHMLIPERFRAAHGGHMKGFFAKSATRPMGSGLDLVALTKGGIELPIEISLSPVRTATGDMVVCAAVRDVSERRSMELAAKLSTERLQNAVESIDDALALYDRNGELLLCNSAYRRLVGGRLTGALVGRPYAQVLDAWLLDPESRNDDARGTLATEQFSDLSEMRRAHDVSIDGRNLRVMNRRTQEGGFVQTVWDLTDDMRREQELKAARQAAEAANVAKSEFLSSMSHELRTPLNAILGFAQLLHRDKKVPLAERHRERIEHVLKGGEHLLHLINEVLDLSSIEAGRVSVSLEPVSVEEVFAETIATVDPMAARAGITLSSAALDPALPKVIADRTRLKQVLMNFASNAIKYGREQGHVVLEALHNGDQLRLAVVDDGIGIPNDKQRNIFQPFFRGGQEAGPIEGTGIGLAISKRLGELMGGRVGFSSVEGQGSRFWIELACHRVHAAGEAVQTTREATRNRGLTHGHGERFLIVYVEDNPANIAFMTELIGDLERVALITAPTAEIGIDLVRARQPHVVIMDINLPGMSGLEATRRLQAWPETQHIPVIALTAAAMPRDAARLSRAGFHKYLTKPVQVEELTRTLEALLLPPESVDGD